jgi:predicted MFS family arabinose efflux permease
MPYLRLLTRNRAFARLYAAQLVSFAGDWFATVALLGLALEATGSTAVASLVLILQTTPFFLVSPIAGVLADRVDRRRLLIASDLFRAAVAVGFLFARDASTFWIALVCVALLSTGAAFFEPTSSASLPNLVEPEDLPAANALMGAAWGTMLAVGAALGGLVTATLGRDAAFLINAGSFALSGLLIAGVHRSFRAPSGVDGPARAPASIRVAVAETLALARRSRLVSSLLLTKATFGAGMGVVLLLAVFGSDVYGAGEVGIGLLFAARGLGALVGPFIGRAIAGTDERGLVTGIGASLLVFLVGYAVMPLGGTIVVAGLFVFIAHLGGGAQWTLSSLGLQRAVPDEIRGRVFSFDYAMALVSITASTLVAGILTGPLGPTATLYVLLALVAVSGAAWLAWSRPLLRPRHPAIASGAPRADVP